MKNLYIKQNIIYRALNYLLRKIREKRRTNNWKNIDPENYLKLKILKDKHKNTPCVIIGNGPSINKMDLNKFKNYIIIACNAFYLKHHELDFTPTYYTVEDPNPAKDNKEKIEELKNTTKIIPFDLRKTITKDVNTIYINFLRSYLRSNNKNFPLFSDDFLHKSYWGGTVTYLNIQLAYYLGCNPIYLIGIDLTYKIPKSVKRIGNVIISTEDDPNHFHPNYFGKGKSWSPPETQRMQEALSKANNFLKEKNVKLFNATIGGKLKEIERKVLI